MPSSFAYETQQSVAQIQLMSGSLQHFDITTPEGRQQAIVDLVFPEWWLIRRVWDSISPGNVEAREIEAQRKTAVEIIRAGNESDVDELEITMSEKAGIGLDTKIEGFPVEFIVGNSGTMTLKVKYKT